MIDYFHKTIVVALGQWWHNTVGKRIWNQLSDCIVELPVHGFLLQGKNSVFNRGITNIIDVHDNYVGCYLTAGDCFFAAL